MKKTNVATIAGGPFGLHMCMSAGAIGAELEPLGVPFLFESRRVPRPHPAFATYCLNPSLTDSAAHQPQNPGFPLRWRERFKPGQALSGRLGSVVP
jgi:hypothetical protein